MDTVTLALAKAYTDSQRIAYVEEVGEPVVVAQAVDTGSSRNNRVSCDIDSPVMVEGNSNLVIWDGVPFRCVVMPTLYSNPPGTYVGNPYLFNAVDYADTGEPFCIKFIISTGSGVVYSIDKGVHTVEIQNLVDIAHPIDQKYIPALDLITLNGADGKQYRLTVDENGALAVTAT